MSKEHLDLYGHMNNAKYLEVCEKFRWDSVETREGDGGRKRVKDNQVGETVLEIHGRFRRELFLEEKIKVTTQYLGFEKKVYKIVQCFVKEDGTVAFELHIKGAVFDLKKRKIISPPKAWLDSFV